MHEYITYIADRAASREVDALTDYYGVGRLIATGELTYDAARDQMIAAFRERNLTPATAKTYLSQGYALAQLFETFEDVEAFADDECAGSRSLKRIYDTVKRAGADDAADAGETESGDEATDAPTPLVDVILANLAHLTDAGEIARVRDAAAAMLTVSVVAA